MPYRCRRPTCKLRRAEWCSSCGPRSACGRVFAGRSSDRKPGELHRVPSLVAGNGFQMDGEQVEYAEIVKSTWAAYHSLRAKEVPSPLHRMFPGPPVAQRRQTLGLALRLRAALSHCGYASEQTGCEVVAGAGPMTLAGWREDTPGLREHREVVRAHTRGTPHLRGPDECLDRVWSWREARWRKTPRGNYTQRCRPGIRFQRAHRRLGTRAGGARCFSRMSKRSPGTSPPMGRTWPKTEDVSDTHRGRRRRYTACEATAAVSCAAHWSTGRPTSEKHRRVAIGQMCCRGWPHRGRGGSFGQGGRGLGVATHRVWGMRGPSVPRGGCVAQACAA